MLIGYSHDAATFPARDLSKVGPFLPHPHFRSTTNSGRGTRIFRVALATFERLVAHVVEEWCCPVIDIEVILADAACSPNQVFSGGASRMFDEIIPEGATQAIAALCGD